MKKLITRKSTYLLIAFHLRSSWKSGHHSRSSWKTQEPFRGPVSSLPLAIEEGRIVPNLLIATRLKLCLERSRLIWRFKRNDCKMIQSRACPRLRNAILLYGTCSTSYDREKPPPSKRTRSCCTPDIPNSNNVFCINNNIIHLVYTRWVRKFKTHFLGNRIIGILQILTSHLFIHICP